MTITITPLDIGVMSRVFANCSGDLGTIPGRVIPKTQKMVLDSSLFNIIRYRSRVKWRNPGNGVTPILLLVVVTIQKGAFWSPSTTVASFTLLFINLPIGIVVSVYQWSGRPGFTPWSNHTKDSKNSALTLSIIRYGSRVKWSNPGKGVVPSPTFWCSSYRKGSLRVTLD